VTARRAKRETGVWERIPKKCDDVLTDHSGLDAQPTHLRSCTSDSGPSEARKRGSGGGSPRKYDDLLTGTDPLWLAPVGPSHDTVSRMSNVVCGGSYVKNLWGIIVIV
jgi:hypothetical protein